MSTSSKYEPCSSGASKRSMDAVLPDPENQLKTLMSLAKRPKINIEFEDVSYYAVSKNGKKTAILDNINGKFRSGELTAILGPSGAGKSTLMNILAGHISTGVTGRITTNGHPRDTKIFHKLSSYIMQDDMLQPNLSVLEYMNIAAKLKAGNELNSNEKITIVEEILSSLGLSSVKNTYTEKLSGGEKKRLSVALELVNNPPIMFLDEPTTGLDNVSINRLMGMLHKLARQGRTIICNIHQPSATLFKTFDQVYVIARGQCVYRGTASMIVPFMSQLGLECPITHNPADFVIETVTTSRDHIKLLVNAILNGKLNIGTHIYPSLTDTIHISEVFEKNTMEFSTSVWTQFSILATRMFLQIYRNKPALLIQLFHHIASGFLIGIIFAGIGNDATKILNNFYFCMCIVAFYMYTHIMTKVLLYPAEVKMLKREYFNRWYGLKSYYMALTISTLPSTIVFGIIFSSITYFMTYQPLDWSRIIWFYLQSILIGICSEGMGLAIGSIFRITNGCVVAPGLVTPLYALAIHGMGHWQTVGTAMKIIVNVSYLRYSLVGLVANVFNNRPLLDCDSKHIYCHYRDTQKFLKELGMENYSHEIQFVGLLCFTMFFRIIAFLVLRKKLTLGFSHKMLSYVNKILRYK